MNFKMVSKAAVLFMLPLALAQHDPSKCLENGKFDKDCCAIGATSSCADGYIFAKGAPCPWAKFANLYTCSNPATVNPHDASKCLENGKFDNDCCALQGTSSCEAGFTMSMGDTVCFDGGSWKAYSYTCTDPALNGGQRLLVGSVAAVAMMLNFV